MIIVFYLAKVRLLIWLGFGLFLRQWYILENYILVVKDLTDRNFLGSLISCFCKIDFKVNLIISHHILV